MDNSPWEQGQHIKDAVYSTQMARRFRLLVLPTNPYSWIYVRHRELWLLRKSLYHINLQSRFDASLRNNYNEPCTGKF